MNDSEFVIFWENDIVFSGSSKSCLSYLEDKKLDGYNMKQFFVFESHPEHSHFIDYYENEEELNLEDLAYV